MAVTDDKFEIFIENVGTLPVTPDFHPEREYTVRMNGEVQGIRRAWNFESVLTGDFEEIDLTRRRIQAYAETTDVRGRIIFRRNGQKYISLEPGEIIFSPRVLSFDVVPGPGNWVAILRYVLRIEANQPVKYAGVIFFDKRVEEVTQENGQIAKTVTVVAVGPRARAKVEEEKPNDAKLQRITDEIQEARVTAVYVTPDTRGEEGAPDDEEKKRVENLILDWRESITVSDGLHPTTIRRGITKPRFIRFFGTRNPVLVRVRGSITSNSFFACSRQPTDPFDQFFKTAEDQNAVEVSRVDDTTGRIIEFTRPYALEYRLDDFPDYSGLNERHRGGILKAMFAAAQIVQQQPPAKVKGAFRSNFPPQKAGAQGLARAQVNPQGRVVKRPE